MESGMDTAEQGRSNARLARRNWEAGSFLGVFYSGAIEDSADSTGSTGST